MSSLFGIGAGSGASGFYNSVATQSLRFDIGSSTYLTRTPSSEGDRRTWTASFWVKRSDFNTSQSQNIFTSGVVNSTDLALFFDTNTTFGFYSREGGYVTTNRVFRDPSAWYHIVVVLDTTQGTASNRVKIYVNGTQETSLANSTYPDQNSQKSTNDDVLHRIGGRDYSSAYNYVGGYLAEFNLIDGTALDPTYFGETKNGVWIPKKYTGSYGTNGFRLEFKQTGTGTASATTIGADTSGNTHHFTSNNLSAHDCVIDSPENNFAVLNAIEPSGATLSEGNLRFTGKSGTGAGYYATRATFGITSGKWYFEGLATDDDSEVGIGTASASLDNYLGGDAHAYGYAGFNGQKYNNNSGSSYGATFGNGDIIGVAFDADNGTLTFYKNGATQGTAFTSLTATPYFPMVGETAQSSPITTHLNFGQDSSFSSNKTAQGNTDGNGIGDFYYAPPSGHLALCSANLPEPSISPNSENGTADDYFNTVLYSGSSSDLSVTGVGFQPDFCWVKRRSGVAEHELVDSVRGASKLLSSDTTGAELDRTFFKSFDVDGFSVETGVSNLNNSGSTYVAWNWKAGGTTPTKTYKVVVVSDSGNKFRFRNSADSVTFAQSAVTLDLQELGTYTFDVSDSSMSGHALKFSTTSDGIHGGGSEYTTGVTSSGTSGQTGAYVQITVASSAPTLYYYCGISGHSGMGGQINTNTTHGSTNFDGSILSVEQANTTAGFSIVTFEGNKTKGATIGHGLQVDGVAKTPAMIIMKNRDLGVSWVVWLPIIQANNQLLELNSAGSLITNTSDVNHYWNNTSPTSTVITLGDYDGINDDLSMVAYCFAEVEGYSKFGSYTGNGATSGTAGTYVHLGFRPSFVMLKSTGSGSWWILDSTRDPHNEALRGLQANSSADETGYSGNFLDFYSNGFAPRTSGTQVNGSGVNYIYMAFAEQPFKYANAR